jgi:4-alpha-glucanotransferase
MAKQAGMSVGLVADVAAGIDPAGSDAWARQDDVLRGVTLGAPPDLFTPAGQDWRLTSFSPQGLIASGFAPFIETLRACLDHVGGLRIDHVMGAQRLWLIPAGMGPTGGAYVNFPAETLFRLIALESWKRRAIVIGEDLGTLPFGFHDYIAEQGITGMRLLRIERNDRSWKSPSHWSRGAAAMTATHDIMATAGWWKGADLSESPDREQNEQARARDRRLLWDAFCDASVAEGNPPGPEGAGQVVDAAFAFIAQTPCEIKLVTLEDVLATDIQPNVPGTTSERPNWRHRFTGTAEKLLFHPSVIARLAKLSSPRTHAEDRRDFTELVERHNSSPT